MKYLPYVLLGLILLAGLILWYLSNLHFDP